MPRRRKWCGVEGCDVAPEYEFDPNYGLRGAPPLPQLVCYRHLAAALRAGLTLQRERGDTWISIIVEHVGVSGTAWADLDDQYKRTGVVP